MQPKFSVVMPVYNVEKYLRNSIQSILNQTISDYELILVDDGSPDNCPKICDEYAAQYPQVRVVHQKNVGLSSARNAGFAIAKGEFVYFPDSDDIIHPDTLDYFKRVIETVPNVKYIISDFQDVTEEEAFKAAGYDHGIEIYSRSQIQVLFLKRQIRILAPGSLLNINWYKDNNLTFENNPYGEDQLFIWKALLHVDEVVHIKKPLYNYLHRPGSIMTASGVQKIIKAYPFFLDLQNLYQRSENAAPFVKKYLLPLWVRGILHSSAKIISYSEAERFAFRQQLRTGGAVDAAVHPTAAVRERGVCGVDDGIDLHMCNVVSDDLQRHGMSPFRSKRHRRAQAE